MNSLAQNKHKMIENPKNEIYLLPIQYNIMHNIFESIDKTC